MKEWQRQKLSLLLDNAEFLNRHSWLALAVGAAFILAGMLLEHVWMSWAGVILIGSCVFMVLGADLILRYVRWRKRQWK